MLKLNNWPETWRDKLTDYIDKAERATGNERDSNYYDDWGQELKREVLNRLDHNIKYELVDTQSVGSFTIVQSGTDAESKAFADALYAALKVVGPRLVEAESQPVTE